MYVTNAFRKRELENEEASETRRQQESAAKKQRRIRQNCNAQSIEDICAISVRCLLPLVLHLPILIVLTEPEQTLSNSLLRSAPKCTTTIAGMHEYRKYCDSTNKRRTFY